jgi:hypothetical protein
MQAPSQANFRIIPLSPAFLARVRSSSGLDDLDQPVEPHLAAGGEPLRDCLGRALPGEPILLASFCPFTVAGPYREYGPIFVAATPQPMPELTRLPVDGDTSYLGTSFVLRAYSREEPIVDAKVSSSAQAVEDWRNFRALENVAFVLARFTAYGCYAMRIDFLECQN